jgi:hypothetical protein
MALHGQEYCLLYSAGEGNEARNCPTFRDAGLMDLR